MVTKTQTPALTRGQWDARDYRQVGHDLDAWAKSEPGTADDDETEYVAKLGLNKTGSVIIMSRSHDRVLVPPPARAPLAAFALAEQPFGFTASDVRALGTAAERSEDPATASVLRNLAQRIEGLIPPET